MKLWHKLIMLVSAILLCAAILFVCIFAPSCGNADSGELPQLVISEIMADNTLTLADSDGDYSDWIEIYNCGLVEADLSRYCLSDDENDPLKWQMPKIILAPGEYLLVFASGKDSTDIEECHTNFKLNGMGESVVLSSTYYGTSVPVSYDVAVADISYGITADGEYKWFVEATPGAANENTEWADDPLSLNSPYMGLIISEYMTQNITTVSDSDGEYSDWIEITNISTKEISLDGLRITDNGDNLDKWSISGSYILGAGESVIVFMSGKDRCDAEMHASFGLGGDDEEIVLSDKHSRIVSRIEIAELADGYSYGVSSDGAKLFFSEPTPGRTNSEGTQTIPEKSCPLAGTVRINEVSAASVSPSTGKAARDWIELYNDSDETVILKGYGLSNDETDPYRFTFTSEKIAPYSCCVVYAVGTGDATKTTAPFKISTDGETLILTSPDGETLDVFETGKLRIGVTSGRTDDTGGERMYFASATRGEENSEGCVSYVTEPEFTVKAGVYSESVTVEIKAQEGATVYYTTDGSVPTTSSNQYNGAITLDKTCVIRAKAFAQGCISSDTATATYLIDTDHKIPIVSMTGNPDGFFSEETGIYAAGPNGEGHGDVYPYTKSNYWRDWERAVSIEYFVDGECAVAFDAGTKIFGQFSRAYAQKSFAIHVRDVYGVSSVTYPFFGDDNEFTEVKGLILRAAGQDHGYARLRDAFCSQVLLSSDSEVLTADWQPVALYLNGKYWGLYNLREKINEDYLELNYGINKDNVTILKGTSQIELAGSMDGFRKLRRYIAQNSMYNTDNYKYVCTKIDISNYMDYIIFVTFLKNNDLRNSRYYLDGAEGSRWKWIMFDMDMSMRSDATKEDVYSLEQILAREPIHKYLLRNKAYREEFIERYAERLNTVFMPENLTGILDDMASQIEPEIENHAERWGDVTYSSWKSEIAYLRKVCNARREILKEQLQEHFSLSDKRMKQLFPNG